MYVSCDICLSCFTCVLSRSTYDGLGSVWVCLWGCVGGMGEVAGRLLYVYVCMCMCVCARVRVRARAVWSVSFACFIVIMLLFCCFWLISGYMY